ncbi:MAG: AI-2E family transporter [Ruthenibacterium lactatiformans]
MKHDSFKTYLHWGLTAFGVVALSILFFFSLFKVGALVHFFQTLLGILMPFVYGLAMAYLLTPVFNWLHARFAPALQKHVKNPRRAARAAKFLSTTLSVLLALLLVAALLWMVLPQVISSIVGLVESNLLTNSIQNDGLDRGHASEQPAVRSCRTAGICRSRGSSHRMGKTDMLPQLTNLMSGLLGTLTFFKNVFIGIIIAIYVLNSKQLFAAQAKKLLYGCLSTRRANIVLDNARFTHRVFGGFINGKLLDSLIIGILCFVGMTALRMPYAMLISVVVGVTNIIPFFGPFIGAIPSGLLILLIDPLKALYFVLFILALQQFDGNILGPKILGDSTGLSSFWVMFAILLAGGLFGFVGMVVGVPLFAVLYSILSGLVCHSLRRRGMPEETQAYYELDHVDERTHDILYNEAPARPAAGSADRPE